MVVAMMLSEQVNGGRGRELEEKEEEEEEEKKKKKEEEEENRGGGGGEVYHRARHQEEGNHNKPRAKGLVRKQRGWLTKIAMFCDSHMHLLISPRIRLSASRCHHKNLRHQ
eukprot:763866-Hanusia_phi.AAC.1